MLFRLIFLLLVVLSLPGGVHADEPNQAGLVVQYSDGLVETRCVVFDEDEITGADLLNLSGLEVVVEPSGLGITVCQIEGHGCAYPADACFCQCMGGGGCAYWNYFYRDADEPVWTYSALGAALRKVQPGSVDAWVWGDSSTPPAGALTFDQICTLPTPTASPTAVSTAPPPATAAPTDAVVLVPIDTPTALPTATSSRPTATPTAMPAAATGPNLIDYWPFGLVLLGLVAIGLIVRLRRA